MSSQNIINLGAKVRHLRTRLNLSIRQLAEKSDVSPGYISQIENGKTNPSVTTLYSIATALGVSIQAFFDVEQSSESPSPVTASEMGANRLSLSHDVQDTSEFGPVIVNRVTADERATIELSGGVTWARLTSRAYENIEFLELTYEPGAESGEKFSRHIGREFGLVLEGLLRLQLGFEEYDLHAGDSILFDSSTPHRLSNNSDTIMRALWVAFNLDT